MSETDDEDLPNLKAKKRIQRQKTSKSKIEDSDSSGDETATQPTDDHKNTKQKRILESSSDEEDHCNSDGNYSVPSAESHTLAGDCNTALGINNLDLNSTNTDLNISNKNPIDNELINGSEGEQSDEGDISHHQREQVKVKSKIRQFADSSSEEENDGLNSSTISASERISERVNAKKYSFRSKLAAVKNQRRDDEHKNNEPASKNENPDGETAIDAIENVPSGGASKLFENNDLFDMEESEDEGPNKPIPTEDDDEVGNQHQDEVCEEPSLEKKGKKKTSKTANDKLRKESRSEQQRLLREQKFNLPYHVPETKPLKDFLTRVPVMKTSKEKRKENSKNPSEPIHIKDSDSDQVGLVQKPKKMDCLFLQKPTLAFGKEEVIEFEQTIEFEPGLPNSNENKSKKKGVLDSFMARFEKHTRKSRKSCEDIMVGTTAANNYETAKEDDKVPGGRRIAFKEVMKKKIHKERREILKETDREMKLYNEDDDESEYGDDEDDSSDSDDDTAEKDVTIGEKEKLIEKPNDNDGPRSQSSDDEELSKWNLEDDRKALELEMEVEEKKQEKSERTAADAIDFTIHPIKTSEHSEEILRKEEPSMHWDDTSSTVSSVLPAGQGEPTSKRKNSSTSDGGRSTPFSKLVPSGLLLDSASKLSAYSSSTHCTSVLIPCEDTQDLYKNDQPTTAQSDEEESESVFNNFQLYVNEDTEYTQACDSQGFLNESKKSIPRQPRQPAKRLFDDDGKDYPNDFSEVIALCSGKFDDEETTSTDAATSKDEGIRKMCSTNSELSMSQVIGLCSGKFTEDNTTASDVNSQCTLQNDESSNPPVEHPFSSRIITGTVPEKESQELPSFRETPENIFSDEFALPKLSKPSCISELINENFDDNAIDFCSAPFSTQASNEISTQRTTSSGDSEKLSQTKVDVEKWLKGDKLANEDELDEHDILRETGGKKKTKRIVESDEDDEEDGVVDEDTRETAEDDEQSNNKLLEGNDGVISSDEENEDDNEVADELLEYQDAISEEPAKKKWLKNAFAEGEAELSGSDINSDDEELGSEYDEYEVDSDAENLPDAEKIKRQVHKIHQRKLMEQDQSELKKLQDMYLEDGDLGDGKKRQRNFKWRNIDNDTDLGNATGAHSGDEEDELNLDTNISQKLERAERERYIHELNESEKVALDENSQSMLEMIKSNSSILTQPPVPKRKPKLFSKSESRVLSQKQTGSFLCQKKSKLSNLSSAAKASGGGHGGKGFVFKTTEEEKAPVEKENKGVQRKAPFAGPAKKRMKINPEVSESSESQSIFDLL